MLYLAEYMSPLGKLSMVSDEVNLKGLWIEGQKYFTQRIEKEGLTLIQRETEVLKKTRKWLDEYFGYGNRFAGTEGNAKVEEIIGTKDFAGQICFEREKRKRQELSLAPEGSEFQKLVWKNLCEIPYGTTISYGELARKIATQMGKERMSAQAVGGAVGKNPISIIIPCHRVIGANGSLTGYAGGVEKKKWLLEWERY